VAASPTQRSLDLLRKDGYLAGVVEKWIPQTRRRKDLFGFIDIMCVKEGETLAVQATSYAGVPARVKKIYEECGDALIDVLAAGWTVEVWGWKKKKVGKTNRWSVRRVKCELDHTSSYTE